MKRTTLGIACVGASLLMMGGFTQPEQSTDHQAPDTANQSVSDKPERPKHAVEIRVNPDALRDRLSRSILHAQQMIDRSTAAIAKLDEGASPSEVLSEMRLQGIARLGTSKNDQRNDEVDHERPALGSPRDGRSPTSMERQERQSRNRPTITQEATNEFMQQNFPKLWKNIELVRAADPRSADRLFGRMQPQIHEILLLTESQPDLAKIKLNEMRAGLNFVDAAGVYRRVLKDTNSTDADKADALNTLHQLAGERFDAQMDSKLFEIQRLEARLNELKDSVENIESQRDREIERMLEDSKQHAKRKAKIKADN